MSDALVRIRCGVHGCNRVLHEFTETPEAWDETVRVKGCPKHDQPRRHIFDEARRRLARGLDPRPELIFFDIRLVSLKHAFYLADTRKKTTEEVIARMR